MTQSEHFKLLTIVELMHLIGYRSRSSIYRMVRQKRLVPPIVVGGGRVRWRADSVESWLKSLPTQTYPSQEGGQ